MEEVIEELKYVIVEEVFIFMMFLSKQRRSRGNRIKGLGRLGKGYVNFIILSVLNVLNSERGGGNGDIECLGMCKWE